MSVFSICFFLFFVVARNLLFLKNYTGNVEDLSLNFTVVNNDLGESQVIEKLPTKVTTKLCIILLLHKIVICVKTKYTRLSLFLAAKNASRDAPCSGERGVMAV